MDKRFLDKVLNQIVSETMVDYDKERLYTPFSPFSLLFFLPYHLLPYPTLPFSKHCKNVYGLNEDEVKYIWNEYKHIIKDMLPY